MEILEIIMKKDYKIIDLICEQNKYDDQKSRDYSDVLKRF